MSKFFNIYENIDAIDPAELKRAAGIKDPDKVTWPKGKKYKVTLAGKECSVTTYFSNAEGSAYGQYDAYTALSTMMTRDEVVDRMWKEDPNGGSDAVNYAYAEFLPGLPELSKEEKEHRQAFTAAVLTLLSDQKTMEAVAECAPRKKNGLFHKGRVFKIGLTGFADKYSNELIEIVGKSKDETKLSVSITGRNTSPDELEAWNQDFISTYHEGLPISEAFKAILENIDDGHEGEGEKVSTIKPTIHDGLGDGSQEIDTSEIDKDKDFLKGVRPKYKEKAQEGLNKLSSYLVDPNKIDWDGKYVYIDRMADITVLNKIREMGAYTLRSNTTTMNYMVEGVDFKSFKDRYSALDEVYYSSSYIGELINIIRQSNAVGIIEERDFLRWCVNGHEIKYDLSKDEHLKKYDNEKMSFKKIDKKMFLKQVLRKINPYQHSEIKDWNNGDILYCVVGSGDKAEKVRNFFKDIDKTVMEHYIEGARWPRLILGDPNEEEEKRAYKLALYNKAAGEKVQVWSADQVLELIDLYGEDIKAYANEDITSSVLDSLAEQIMKSANVVKDTEVQSDVKTAEESKPIITVSDIEHMKKTSSDVTEYIITPDKIDCSGKTFVFDRSIELYKVYDRWFSYKEYHALAFDDESAYYKLKKHLDYYNTENPVVKEIMEAGGVVRREISGKTDYYIKNTEMPFSPKEIQDIVKQKEKGKPLMIIPLSHFKRFLSQEVNKKLDYTYEDFKVEKEQNPDIVNKPMFKKLTRKGKTE